MIECLQLRGLSARTQESYLRAVRQLAEHYHKAPDLITEAELRQYFLFLKNVKRYSRPTMTIAICGIRFFYKDTLNREWTIFGIVRPAPEKKLPVILSLAEVRQILRLIRLPRYQVCLSTIYSCGLRLQEGTHLQVADIDSARMMIHVRHGKGAKDRYVPLPQRTLQLLRQYWKTHRNPRLLFPAEGRDHIDLAQATEPMSVTMVCSARPSVICCARPDNCSRLIPANY
jgi:site-specific recombinase XerD